MCLSYSKILPLRYYSYSLTHSLTHSLTYPLEHGRAGGAAGFFKGVGLGIVGAAVKPIQGVSDGIASIAQGVTNQIADAVVIPQARPCRTFERSEIDRQVSHVIVMMKTMMMIII